MSQGVVQDKVSAALVGALRLAQQRGLLKVEQMPVVNLEAPKRPEWGDVSSTLAMSMSASERRPPFEIAQIIIDHIEQRDALFNRVEIVRPGFLNLTVKQQLWMEVLHEIEAQGAAYGHSQVGKARRVLVEYVSANPTGPLHVGHGRGAAVGQALVRLLKATGHEVVSEYYINDAGRQMKLLGVSVLARYLESCGRPVPFPEDGYHGDYIRAVAARVKAEQGEDLLSLPTVEAEERSKNVAYQELLTLIRQDLETFGITFESWFSEASLLSSGTVVQVLSELKTRDLLFDQDGAQWFRSSAFGDEKDRVVRKQEGDYTYLASDIAYHRDKLRRGFDLLVDVWGADHHGYIPRMQAVVQAYGYPKERLRVVLVQMVNLLRGGQKVEMSKRAGEFITLREVMDEVGADAAKFFFLMRDANTHLDFDLELANSNRRRTLSTMCSMRMRGLPVSGVWRQRAVSTVRSRVRQTSICCRTPMNSRSFENCRRFRWCCKRVRVELEPHRMAYYLRELAGMLHPFYNKHRILPPAPESETALVPSTDIAPSTSRHLAVVTPGLTGARLALMWAVQQVVRNGLNVLGVSAPEQM